jgi:hypothetical protein
VSNSHLDSVCFVVAARGAVSYLSHTWMIRRREICSDVSQSMSRDSSVGIATGYGLDDQMIGVRFPAGLGIFLLDITSILALRPTQFPIQ